MSDISPELNEIDNLLNKIQSYDSQADLDLVRKAYLFSKEAHSGQFRRSGEPYIFHPLGVAEILADLRLDIFTVITGLLHDTVEDTKVTLVEIEKNFGKTVEQLVDGVTKISQMSFKNTHDKQSENIRKMIVAMGKDVRVILVKLADRLHNMRTLSHMPYEKQLRIGQETLDIYAPLASRLGINSVKIELEDLAFRYANPEMYYSLAQRVTKKKKEREKYIDDVKQGLTTELSKYIQTKFRVQGRPKHLYSIYKKMTMSGIDYEHIYDVLAFRVIVDTVPHCYEVLGHIHALWKPIPGRFKDFIAMPKANNYQSLHTTVIGPGGERIEIQIRTEEMHLVAERGIAAHWSYKEGNNQKITTDMIQQMSWLQDLVSQNQNTSNSGEFLENIKTELNESRIYVFTPNGDVRELTEDATPVDFAFAIHTDVGFHCVAARVNGKMVPLKQKLRNGDTVEIITAKTKTPSKDWLKFCVTSKAKSRIRAFLQNEEKNRAHQLGQDLLEKEFRKVGYSIQRAIKPESFSTNEDLRKTGANDIDDLFVRVGYGKILPKQIVEMLNLEVKAPVVETKESFLQKIYKSAVKKERKTRSLISVDGMDDILVRFGRCCNPIPGDPIRGFISRGRGITIHKADCTKVFSFDVSREVDVGWTTDSAPAGVERTTRIRVISSDSPGLLKSMSEVFSSLGINILNAQVRVTKDLKAVCLFDVAVKDTKQLTIAIQNLQKVKGILAVTRVSQT